MITRILHGHVPIIVTAALSVALLIAVSGMQIGKSFAKPPPLDISQLNPVSPREYVAIEDADGNGTPDWHDELLRAGLVASSSPMATTTITSTSSDPVAHIGGALVGALIGGYLSLADHDAYTPDRGEQLANTIADNFRAPEVYVPLTVEALKLDPNTSSDRSIRYRTDVRFALEPLISDEEYELTLYAAYIETGDATWLGRLTKAAERYRAAQKNLLALSIPQNAAGEHLRLINALGSYAETLDRMVRFAKDPFASMALLTTYNERERELNLAFDALIKYYARTIGDN